MKYIFTAILTAIFFIIPNSEGRSDDWPTYQHDISRSGTTSEELQYPLKEAWSYESIHSPSPAWPPPAKQDFWHKLRELRPTTVFDRAYHVVVADEIAYFGSSTDDKVYALDAATGKELWTFFTEGPVRFAPTVDSGKVYVGSDDGQVYCLSADAGKLLWKHRIADDSRKIPGNGRMISVWPIRSSILVDGGVAYCCAGILPAQEVYRCALKADSGQIIWKHKSQDISAQGYLLASPSRLYVATGRTSPTMIERTTGKNLGAISGSGGAYALLTDGNLLSGPGRAKGQLTLNNTTTKDNLARFDGLRMLVKDAIAYMQAKDGISAFDFSKYSKTKNQEKSINWKQTVEAPYSMILAGQTILAGGDGKVIALDTSNGKQKWSAVIAGKAYGLAVSGSKLFVSTDQGIIHCFQEKIAPSAAVKKQINSNPFPEDELTNVYAEAAEYITGQLEIDKGYCLVLGSEKGRLAYEIAKQTKLHVIGIEEDKQKVYAARTALDQAGLYGKRVTIHHGSLTDLPFSSYFANLVVSDRMLLTGTLPESFTELYRVLRPGGGVAYLGQPETLGKNNDSAEQKKNKETIRNSRDYFSWEIEEKNPFLTALKRKPLPGAGQWTHIYASPANTTCSNDRLQGPMQIQWFGEPGPRDQIDRHHRPMSPLYKNGLLIVPGDDRLVAVDGYNGSKLWAIDVPYSRRIGTLKNSGHVVLSDKFVYITSRDECRAYDTYTGRLAEIFKTTEQDKGEEADWGYLAQVDDQLFGTNQKKGASFSDLDFRGSEKNGSFLLEGDFKPVVVSDSIFSLDRNNGNRLWTYSNGLIMNNGITIGSDRLFLLESRNPEIADDDDGRIRVDHFCEKDLFLVALNTKTGDKIWEEQIELPFQQIVYLCYANDTVLATGSWNVGKKVQYDLFAFDADDGTPKWHNHFQSGYAVGGEHGEQWQHPVIIHDTVFLDPFSFDLASGKKNPFRLGRGGHGCGTLSGAASYMFGRGGNPRMYDVTEKTPTGTRLTFTSRPGCWINMLPVGGMVLVPEASSGCTCAYPLQTSFAFAPRSYYAPPMVLTSARSFSDFLSVPLSATNGIGNIHYTIDGSDPTDKSPRYKDPIKLTRTTTIKARTYWGDLGNSGITETTFTKK